MAIRLTTDADAPAIDAILQEAFGGAGEAELVTQLRRESDLVMELVAECGAGIKGCIAFPRLHIETNGRVTNAVALAPLAVAKRSQGQGIGGALVKEGCIRLADQDASIVFVLGEPGYYGRFGFRTELATRFTSPYSGPYFMARALGANVPVSGTVRYPAAFGGLR